MIRVIGVILLTIALPGLGWASAPSNPEAITAPSGKKLALSHVAPGFPVAIVVIKGDWCATCIAQLESLALHQRVIDSIGARVIGMVYEGNGRARAKLNDLPIGLPVFGATEHLFGILGLWTAHRAEPTPGLIFLDRCGRIMDTHAGRTPGISQNALIFRSLMDLAEQPSKCGLLI
ncbi:MAG: hypothetical protein VX834_08790 [Myxococcota bacterium]|nr:hypothetical protein [Myxococcota bacterium]